jgi:exonuclease SbcC
MHIRLQNIKCYTDMSFDFGEDGLALLSGQSGKGKSTVLQAINFALFGVGNKIISSGKNSCKVDFEFDGMKIMRSKNPGKLVVNEIYEGDAAQDMINNKFGATFDVTGYIPQNAIKSFVLMNPQDKLGFLERFAFDDVNLSEMKIRCKDHISKKHEELIAISSKLEMVIEMADKVEEPELIEFPLKVKNDNYEKAIRNEQIRLKNSNTFIEGNKISLSLLATERQDVLLYNSKLTTTNTEIEELESSLDVVNEKIDSLKDTLTGEEILELANEINSIISNRELVSTTKQYEKDKEIFDQMVAEGIADIRRELLEVSAELWEEYTKDDVAETIEVTNELLRDVERLAVLSTKEKKYNNTTPTDKIRDEINENQETLRIAETQEGLHVCPSCNVSLRFSKLGLVSDENVKLCDDKIDKDALKSDISKLEIILKIRLEMDEINGSYEDELPKVDEVNSDLDYLRQYDFTHTRNEKRKTILENNLTNNDLSQTCKQLESKLKQSLTRITKLKGMVVDKPTTTMTEDEIRVVIEREKHNTLIRKDALSRQKEIKTKLKNYVNVVERMKVDHLDKHVKRDGEIENHISVIESEIQLLDLQIIKFETNRVTHTENLLIVERWTRMKDDLSKYQAMQSRVTSLQEDELESRNRYAALTTLREHILEAESIAMMNIVESINTHARVYLDSFFEDDPIVVNLQAFKQTKKVTKAQINMEIEYKGMECDLQMMSGGEMSRIILAYTLALAEMFNTPLLLLDECTASLDQETADHVFESIRENFNGKLTLIVAHQVVTGTFDKTVSLDTN